MQKKHALFSARPNAPDKQVDHERDYEQKNCHVPDMRHVLFYDLQTVSPRIAGPHHQRNAEYCSNSVSDKEL